MKYQSQRGVALVITLIMLSVITFLTVAFLAVSRRDRVSVTTSLSQTDSHLMADTALARFQSEVTARMMSQGSLQSYDLMLTRNYINPTGYVDAIPVNSIDTNNVNYDFRNDGQPLSRDDQIRNIANLLFDPRPPVYVKTNNDTTLPLDFRFYIDYNRNYRFETNGLLPVVIDELGNTNGTFENVFGEPEWIGVLLNPEYPHSPTNRFVGRYLYLALPIGRTLDLNYIHNYAKGDIGMPPQMNTGDGFIRNQGFGSWEINLAAFLTDLNRNAYVINAATPYTYLPNGAFPNQGEAFDDALSFLHYRYNGNHYNLAGVLGYFGNNGINFQTDLIDGFSTTPILAPPFVNITDPDFTLVTPVNPQPPWSGSKNSSNFYDLQDLFNPNKVSPFFIKRLTDSIARKNSYDRYTFSRLLQQIGTGSEPEVLGKFNLNYTNNPAVNIVSTNFVEWTPLEFFTNLVNRLIKENLQTQFVAAGVMSNFYMFNTNDPANLVQTNFSHTNIQIFPTNEYTAPFHRLLQVAANIYDATSTNRFPTVFRPQYKSDGTTNYIIGYTESSKVDTKSGSPTDNFLLNTWTNRSAPNLGKDDNIYGIPLVIGAKKGLPNFNKFVVQTALEISRTLQIIKQDTNRPPIGSRVTVLATNQMLSLGVSNVFAVEAWNSYLSTFNVGVELRLTNQFSMVLTNSSNQVIWPLNGLPFVTNFARPPLFLNVPPGWAGAAPNTLSNSFIVLPFATNTFNFLSNLTYLAAKESFEKTTNYENSKDPSVGYKLPNWNLVMTNQLTYVLIATNENRLVDYVNFDNLSTNIDIGRELSELASTSQSPIAPAVASMWITNRYDNSSNLTGNILIPTDGIKNQVLASMNLIDLPASEWSDYNKNIGQTTAKAYGITNFAAFMGIPIGGRNLPMPPTTTNQTPFNPVLKIYQTMSWEINDPLVHYMPQDLLTPPQDGDQRVVIQKPKDAAPPLALRRINNRYRPWGRKFGANEVGPLKNGSTTDEEYAYDLRVKDPRVRWSDDWDFPTNKFPNIGWLGRVHRGTPWQTIYLKAAAIVNRTNITDIRKIDDIGPNWKDWSGHIESHPTNDWKLMDYFTVAANDNAARGLLSVNQTNQAAWSAVLGGVVPLTNYISNPQANQTGPSSNVLQSLVIQPGFTVGNLVSDINAIRASKPNGVFASLGDFLSVPKLTAAYVYKVTTNSSGIVKTNEVFETSPFLNASNYVYLPNGDIEVDSATNRNQRFYGLTDEAYERVPRQIMSLLKLGEPRFVVYCYGQSLKPAPNSIVLSPPDRNLYFNLCTNYQITGEVATRTVLRVVGTPENPKAVIDSYNVLPSE